MSPASYCKCNLLHKMFNVLTISQIQISAINSFILTRNRFANEELALALGIWHFTVKSHIDVKCVYSRFGNIVSDNTVWNALDSMMDSSLATLRDSMRATME